MPADIGPDDLGPDDLEPDVLEPDDLEPDDLEDMAEVSEDARDEFSNFENITPQEMQDWIWNEAEEDFYPPVIEPHPPPEISRPRAPHIRRL